MTGTRLSLLIAVAVFVQSACTNERSEPASLSTSTPPAASAGHASDSSSPLVVVHKTASCGCCAAWVEHLRTHGFDVDVRDAADLAPVKDRAGVPSALRSCHTAQVGGYFVEGHVPARDVARLLTEKPEASGLTVPGMPLGSPGMEYQNQHEPYDVLLVHADGTTTVFAHYER